MNPEPPAITDFLHHVDQCSPKPDIPVKVQKVLDNYHMDVICPCCLSSLTMLLETPFEADRLVHPLNETAMRVHYILERKLTHV